MAENKLEITAKQEEDKEGEFRRKKVYQGCFLPGDAVTDEMEADYKRGVLTISFPKTKAREIKIK